ncbi:class I SAM-dependent methyltransferase [Anaeromicropila populeti]|uniref:Methyltransferase domain-containing protein n=1 Tax=Anaeromicropila populeti TaxID=37658 RepID=A0A1I6L0M6_9FIRM|nr:class I SAM-dependent methyltransferase [Anaeromicropila populeti]SFR97033.1 Methyltransferase domain-containing protein [Anaeromicropila populeti]
MSLRTTFYNIIMYPVFHSARTRIDKNIDLLHIQTILDICCGTGTQLKRLNKKGYHGIGVDNSEQMLEDARKGKYAPECRKQDATNLEFNNDSFDLVLLSLALHEKELTMAQKMVHEAVRVTKKGNYIMIVEFCIEKDISIIHKMLIYFIEKISGKEHYSNFLNFKNNLLLDNMIDKDTMRLVKQDIMKQNGIQINIYKKI